MRICFSDTFTGEHDFVDTPGSEFSPEAVCAAVHMKIADPENEWVPVLRVEAFVVVAHTTPGYEQACFILRDVATEHEPMLFHGTVYMSYDPKLDPLLVKRMTHVIE